jgi:hypothetical protein
MKPRHRFVIARSSISGYAILDADQIPADEKLIVHEKWKDPLDLAAAREACLCEAIEVCAMLNREEEMREAIDGRVLQ